MSAGGNAAGADPMVVHTAGIDNRVARSRALRLTAAVPSNDVLSVVTLCWTGQHLRLVPAHSQFFHLKSEDQTGVQEFAHEVATYFAARGIRLLVVRQGPRTGPQHVTTGTTRMETALQLSQVRCVNPHVQRVRGWGRSKDWLLPLPQPGYRAEIRRLQGFAIETAAYGIAMILEACSNPSLLGAPQPQRER